MKYRNRREAGRLLGAAVVKELRKGELVNPLVLGLPRGGVPVAFEVAATLGCDLDVIVTRKLGVPFHEELACGAIGPEGVEILDKRLMSAYGITEEQIAEISAREFAELSRRQSVYRAGLGPLNVSGRDVILVDDGIATGATMKAAAASVKKCGAKTVIVAVPVAPEDAAARLGTIVNMYLCPYRPAYFSSVGEWYDDFTQTSDAEVLQLLQCAKNQKISSPDILQSPVSQSLTQSQCQ